MKKWIAALLMLIMCFALCACEADDSDLLKAKTEGVYCYLDYFDTYYRHVYRVTLDGGKILFEYDPGWGSEGIDAEPWTIGSGKYKERPDGDLDIIWDEQPDSSYSDFYYNEATRTFSFTHNSEKYQLYRVHKKDAYGHKAKEIIKMAEEMVMDGYITASPTVTKFCSDKECTAICYGYGNDEWIVKGYVDTQNETGQTVRYDWFAVLYFGGEPEPQFNFSHAWLKK